MAVEQSRFFDSVSDDRVYQAEQFAEYFRTFLTDGILNGGNNLRVTATGSGMQVKVDYGSALIQGYGYWLVNDGEGDMLLQVPASETSARIDRVVLRLNRSLSERTVKLVVKQGTAGANPNPPTLERTGNIYELSLAKISVAANALQIQAGDITDERYDSTVCGLVNSLIQLDGTDFQEQAEQILYDLANQGYLPLTGGTMTGPIAMSGKKITGLAEPVANNDAVNKGYVDNIKISGQNLLLDSEKERPTTRLLVITVGDILADHVGKEIEVSFDMKTAGTLRDIRVYNYQNSGFSIADTEYFQNTELNKWERFGFITTVVQRAGTYNIGAIAWYDEAGNNNYAVRKINIKLRHKTTESDWTPALKDIGLPKNIFSDCFWSDVGTYSARRARVYEGLNMVYIHAVKVMPSQQTETFICRLPSAYRPPLDIKAPWSNQYTHGGIVCEASTGNITAYSKDAVVGFDVNIWIPLGSA